MHKYYPIWLMVWGALPFQIFAGSVRVFETSSAKVTIESQYINNMAIEEDDLVPPANKVAPDIVGDFTQLSNVSDDPRWILNVTMFDKVTGTEFPLTISIPELKQFVKQTGKLESGLNLQQRNVVIIQKLYQMLMIKAAPVQDVDEASIKKGIK